MCFSTSVPGSRALGWAVSQAVRVIGPRAGRERPRKSQPSCGQGVTNVFLCSQSGNYHVSDISCLTSPPLADILDTRANGVVGIVGRGDWPAASRKDVPEGGRDPGHVPGRRLGAGTIAYNAQSGVWSGCIGVGRQRGRCAPADSKPSPPARVTPGVTIVPACIEHQHVVAFTTCHYHPQAARFLSLAAPDGVRGSLKGAWEGGMTGPM